MSFKLPTFKIPKFNLKLSTRVILGLVVLVLFVGGSIAFAAQPLVPIGASWEVGGNINRIRMYSTTSGGWHTFYPDDTDLAYGSYVTNVDSQIKMDDGSRPDDSPPEEPNWTEAQCPDSQLYLFGSSQINTHVDNLVPVGKDEDTGKWTKVPDGTLHRYYTKNESGVIYGFAHFVFLQVVQAKTAGVAGTILDWPVGTCQGLPYWDQTGVPHRVNLRIFVEVNLRPWSIVDGQIVQIEGNDYEINDPFMGVMSASVFPNGAVSASILDVSDLPLEDDTIVPGVYAGTAPGSITGTGEDVDLYWSGLVQPSKPAGGALPMWVENTTDIVTRSVPGEDDVTSRSNSTVYRHIVYEVGGQMEPGLAVNANYWGDVVVGWHAWTAVQKLMYYLVRVDVVTSFGVTLIAGDPDVANPIIGDELPPLDESPSDRFWKNLGGAGDWWFGSLEDLAEAGTMPLVMIAIVAVCALAFYLLLKLGILRRGASAGGLS